mgnify:CR=1 FL=1
MKYRILSNKELEPLKDDFIKFLSANTVTGEDWAKIKSNKPNEALKLVEIFSDIDPSRSNDGKFKILFIGSVTDRKKPHMIIDALPELINDQVEVHIVGPTPNQNYLESLKDKIKSKNI